MTERARVPAGNPGGGQFAKTAYTDDAQVFADIQSIIAQDEFAEYGIRIDDVVSPLRVGDDMPESRIWVDGEPTSDTVGGTSTLGIEKPERIGDYMRQMGATDGSRGAGYFGKVMYLVGGDRGSYGEDPGERVIENAKVVAVFIREKNAFAGVKYRI